MLHLAKKALPERVFARQLDKFYTDVDVAARLFARVVAHLGASADSVRWLEPSAGGGAFFDCMPEGRRTGLDIAPPEHRPDIIAADFLAWRPEEGEKTARVAVGNPPFGKNSSLALRFLNHAAGFCDVVAFVLPRTFEKESMIRRVMPRLHLVHQEVLGDGSFRFMGEPRTVPSVFQIWELRTTAREVRPSDRRHEDFEFVRDHGLADLAIRRVGVRAGAVFTDPGHRSRQSHHFLRVNGDSDRLAAILSGIDWSPVRSRTAGNPSLAQTEIVAMYATAKSGRN